MTKMRVVERKGEFVIQYRHWFIWVTTKEIFPSRMAAEKVMKEAKSILDDLGI